MMEINNISLIEATQIKRISSINPVLLFSEITKISYCTGMSGQRSPLLTCPYRFILFYKSPKNLKKA